MTDIIPSHIVGRHIDTLNNPRDTLDQKQVDIGGYIRISTTKDAQLSSIEYQKKLLQQWAEVNGYNLIRFYIDMRSGGYSYLRDELNEMRQDIRTGRIKGVVAKEISRTSRDVMDILELKREIVGYGGFFLSIKENYDSRTDDDEFFLVLHAAIAQKERKQTAGRVKLTQIIKAKEGKTNVASPAYGYMLSEDRQYLVVNPETAPIYRFIVEKFMDGWGQLKIAKYLNKEGIPSKRGKKWCSNAIRTIINNPVYLGITVYNVTTVVRDASGKRKLVVRPREEWIVKEGTHQPLISEEEFERIQQIVRERREKDVKEWSCTRKYLGSSILYCAECGGKIYGSRMPKKVKGKKVPGSYYYRYYCYGKNGKCSAPMKIWDMKKVDFLIMELFKIIFSNRERLNKAINDQSEIFNEDNEAKTFEREEIKAKLAQIEKAMKKQQIAYEEDVLDLEEYKERVNELRKEKQIYSQRLQKLNDTLNKADQTMEKINKLFARIEDKLDNIQELSKEEKMEFIEATFEKIYLTKDYKITDVFFRL